MTLSDKHKAKKKERKKERKHFLRCNTVRLLDTVRANTSQLTQKPIDLKNVKNKVNLTLFPVSCDIIRNRLLIRAVVGLLPLQRVTRTSTRDWCL